MPTDPILRPKLWRVIADDPVLEEEFVRSLPASRTICRLLLARGIRSLDEAHRFLKPDLADLHDPSLLDGMDWAVMRTSKAIDSREKIMVHGDYDVDGITSTALLVRVFNIVGADVSWYVPHRQKEGYDIGLGAVEEAKKRGVTLIITVDCGTSACQALQCAKDAGIDVIVTDHHEPPPTLAPAAVVINPRKPGCPYPFKDLAGVGVAFKFAEALVRDRGYDTSAFRRKFCDLAAIGTVGDVVPLLGENRVLVKYGMQELPRTGKKGLRALMSVSMISGHPINSYALAYVLAPRLNAAGRLDDASIALELLLTNDEQEADRLAGTLEAQNKERQTEQERITREALEQIASRRLDETAKVLVLSSQSWHPGVVGIVASKITDRYSRPAILVAVDETGLAGVGSARSIAAFNLFEALMRCRDLLGKCGGHARAAGLSIEMEKFPEFDSAINQIADEILAESDLVPQLEIDAQLDLDAVTKDFAYELQLLEPYGHCNREPVFLSERAPILQKNRMGANGAHLKLKLGASSGPPVECPAFGWGSAEEVFRVGSLIDMCYNIRLNRFNGLETVQAVLCDARESGQ